MRAFRPADLQHVVQHRNAKPRLGGVDGGIDHREERRQDLLHQNRVDRGSVGGDELADEHDQSLDQLLLLLDRHSHLLLRLIIILLLVLLILILPVGAGAQNLHHPLLRVVQHLDEAVGDGRELFRSEARVPRVLHTHPDAPRTLRLDGDLDLLLEGGEKVRQHERHNLGDDGGVGVVLAHVRGRRATHPGHGLDRGEADVLVVEEREQRLHLLAHLFEVRKEGLLELLDVGDEEVAGGGLLFEHRRLDPDHRVTHLDGLHAIDLLVRVEVLVHLHVRLQRRGPQQAREERGEERRKLRPETPAHPPASLVEVGDGGIVARHLQALRDQHLHHLDGVFAEEGRPHCHPDQRHALERLPAELSVALLLREAEQRLEEGHELVVVGREELADREGERRHRRDRLLRRLAMGRLHQGRELPEHPLEIRPEDVLLGLFAEVDGGGRRVRAHTEVGLVRRVHRSRQCRQDLGVEVGLESWPEVCRELPQAVRRRPSHTRVLVAEEREDRGDQLCQVLLHVFPAALTRLGDGEERHQTVPPIGVREELRDV
mmetsp:Transcript_26129/g.59603  ORF Transcript_26129/g.59603 Transcript_26129/m.59603 type:complete len:545 (+) Transcript_26129:669-2303(+)